jgi:translocator protein
MRPEVDAEQPNNPIPLLLFLTATCGVGFLATQLSIAALRDSYPVLPKPAWALPNWTFVPVWTILYGIQGFAAWRVWSQAGRSRLPLAFFWLQLLGSGAWAGLLFFWNLPGYALAAAVFALLLCIPCAVLFLKRYRNAGLLMLAALGWNAYLAALTYAVWRAS